MNQSMINASVTMNGLMRKMDVISNNLSNLNTDGYKKQDASFEDLLTSLKQQNPKQELPGRMSPLGLTIGSGARLAQVQINMAQGSLRATEHPYDLAIEGDALFEIGLTSLDADGNVVAEPAWTRNGAFRVSVIPGDPENMMLTTTDGHPVYNSNGEPMLVPSGREISVDAHGNVYASAQEAGMPAELVGTLKLVRPTRPQLLQVRGENLYVLPPQFAADPAVRDQLMLALDAAAEEQGGSPIRIRQGYLEGSNVDLTVEMAELIQVQRAFQLNARALTSSDTMMEMANRLRG